MLHLDIKKLNRFARPGHWVTGDRRGKSRGAGWDYIHVAIDDHSRVAHATIWPDEIGLSAVRALIATLRYYRSLGIRFTAVLTDNGAYYQSRVFAKACRRLGLRHRRTRPYRPRTNGKAERWIQTALHEWAYAHVYQDADERAAYLPHWLHDYNWHRPHASLQHKSPVSRLSLDVNNAREMLEREVVQSAATQVTDNDIAHLYRLRGRITAPEDVEDGISADYEFHEHLAWMTGNPIIMMLVQGLASVLRQVLFHRRVLVRSVPDAAMRTNATHDAIIEALEARDLEAARDAMLCHFRVWNEQSLTVQARLGQRAGTGGNCY